jgi:polyhydroxyalkanoate synthase subunit PhaC
MGLVVGRTAAKTTVPTIIDFVRRRSDPIDASPSAGTAEQEA